MAVVESLSLLDPGDYNDLFRSADLTFVDRSRPELRPSQHRSSPHCRLLIRIEETPVPIERKLHVYRSSSLPCANGYCDAVLARRTSPDRKLKS